MTNMLPQSRIFEQRKMIKSAGCLFAGMLNLLLLANPAFSTPLSPPIHEWCGATSTSRDLCPPPLSPVALERSSTWKLARAKGPKDGETYVSILKTADTMRSDPDFAGLMVRCGPQGKIDVLIALIQPFPPRSHPKVTIGSASTSQVFEGTMAAAGAAVVLPDETAALASGSWQKLRSLTVSVKENNSEIKGLINLDGLSTAYNLLIRSCTQ